MTSLISKKQNEMFLSIIISHLIVIKQKHHCLHSFLDHVTALNVEISECKSYNQVNSQGGSGGVDPGSCCKRGTIRCVNGELFLMGGIIN